MTISHNYIPSVDSAAYSSHCYLSEAIVDKVKQMFNRYIKLKEILHTLQQKYNLKIKSENLYNLRAKLNQEELNDWSSIQAL